MDSVSARSGYLKSAELCPKCEIEMRRPHFSNAPTLNRPNNVKIPGHYFQFSEGALGYSVRSTCVRMWLCTQHDFLFKLHQNASQFILSFQVTIDGPPGTPVSVAGIF